MRLRQLPIQRRLVGFILVTTLTALLGSCLALFVYESRASLVRSTESLTTMADIIASNSTAALIYDDPNLAREILDGLRAEPDVNAAAIFNGHGKLFASYPQTLSPSEFPAVPRNLGANGSFRRFQIFKPITQNGNRVGTLFIRSDLRGTYRRLRVYGLVMLIVLSGAGLFAYFLSNFFQRRITKPILSLAETARVVSQAKDYSVRATRGPNDEVGFVTDAFNAMLEQIQLNHAALGESEERFRAVADSAPVLIWVMDAAMLGTWFNKYWLTFVGHPLEKELGRGWMENLTDESRATCLKALSAAYETQRYFRLECQLRRHDGQFRWLLVQGAPRFRGSEFVGFIGSCVDINDSKLAEEMIRLSELQLRLVTDRASVFLCHFDGSHRYRFVNRAYANRYGLAPEEVVGRSIAEVIGEGVYECVRGRIEAALAGSRQEFEMELPYTALGPRWMHVVYEPVRRDDGPVSGVVAVLSDLTERQFAAKELERARDEALKASRAKDDFLAALSHELRTPLSPILLLATEAATDANLSPEVRADFETIRKNVELEARLIDDLLDLTRITKGKMVLEQKPVNVNNVLRDALATIQEDIELREIEEVIELDPGAPTVNGDAVRLQQVFWNVLKNAVKFTPRGGRIAVVSEVTKVGQAVSVRIADTGIGIASDDLAHVFEAFTQGSNAKGLGAHRFGGLGLGLAISRKMVEMHGGRISAQSPGPDLGSTFSIELPTIRLGRDEAIDLPAQEVGCRPSIAPIPPGIRRKILLVEDHQTTRLALERLLRRRGYFVHGVGSVAEARLALGAAKVDFVISDIGLPDGNGYELMAEFEQLYQLQGIALTGYGMETDIVRSKSAGFVFHLTKPVTAQALDSAIAALKPIFAGS